MTKRDFELLAKALNQSKPVSNLAYDYVRFEYDQWFATVNSIATALATTNPRFDQHKFIKACQGD